MTLKVHHVALTVKDTDESIEWYKTAFGFAVTNRYNKHGMEITILLKDSVRLELFCYGADSQPLPEYRKDLMQDLHVMGTKHLSIEVENIEETVKDLQSKGVEFVMELDSAGFGGRYIFLKDCNDILIELYQP